jgi:hypothetical protein
MFYPPHGTAIHLGGPKIQRYPQDGGDMEGLLSPACTHGGMLDKHKGKLKQSVSS